MSENFGPIAKELLRFFAKYGEQLYDNGFIKVKDPNGKQRVLELVAASQKILDIHDHSINIGGIITDANFADTIQFKHGHPCNN